MAAAGLGFFRDQVELLPAAVGHRDDALGAQDRAVFAALIQLAEDVIKLFLRVFAGGLAAPARENFVGVMFAVMVMVVMMVMAVFIIMIVMMMAFVFFIIVMMVMAAAFIIIIVIVMVMVAALVLIAIFVMIVMMVMMVLLLFLVVIVEIQLEEAQVTAVAAFQRVQDSRFLQLGPGRRDHGRVGVQFTQERRGLFQLFVAHFLGAGKNEGRSAFHLVLKEFAEVLQINFCFLHVHDGDAFGHGQIRNNVPDSFHG